MFAFEVKQVAVSLQSYRWDALNCLHTDRQDSILLFNTYRITTENESARRYCDHIVSQDPW